MISPPAGSPAESVIVAAMSQDARRGYPSAAKMKRLSLRHRYAQTALAAAAWLLFCVPAQAQDTAFCAALKRATDARPKAFAPLKVKPFHGSTREWDARVKLPGMQFCRVDPGRKIYNCWITGLSASWTTEAAAKIKERLIGCLGQPAEPAKSEDVGSTNRTIIVWDSEGARIELVTRIGKQKPEKHSVFVYVR
jgi:hypothetical protein